MSRYEYIDRIGTGGMGTVFLGRREDGMPVAIKQQHEHLVDDPDALASFMDEARLAARIKHPNVVSVIDFAMSGGNLVLVMEYVEGASLAALQRSIHDRTGGPMAWTEAVRVMADALRGLDAAHELTDHRGELLGVIHRDVSPQNIIVGIDGVTRVTDFGVARAAGRLRETRTGAGVPGKLRYLSPEQVQRGAVDRRADIFAAGIVLWECLTGESLFGAETEAETIAAVVRGGVEPPSAYQADIPLEVDEICLRALEREPSRRFATAADFADALDSVGAAAHEQIAATVTECTGEELAQRQALLAQPRREDTEVLVMTETPRTARPRGAAPVVVGALLVGVLAGGLAVGLVARRQQTEVTPPPIEIEAVASIPQPPAAAEPPPRPVVAAPPVSEALPVSETRSQPTRHSTPKTKPARQARDAGAPEFVPKEM